MENMLLIKFGQKPGVKIFTTAGSFNNSLIFSDVATCCYGGITERQTNIHRVGKVRLGYVRESSQ